MPYHQCLISTLASSAKLGRLDNLLFGTLLPVKINLKNIIAGTWISTLLVLCGCAIDPFYSAGTVQQEVNKAVDSGFDGMVIYVNRSGEGAFYSAGFNDREQQSPADPHDLFKIASISKLYIAAATSKLVASNELALNQTLAELIPETQGNIAQADTITLAMLLRHRSGIPEYIYHPNFNSESNESYLETAELIFNQSLDFAPNKKYEYSNTNYLLLGEILDRTLGYSHHQYVQSEILQPLGLTRTFSLFSEVQPEEVMSGYYLGYQPDLKLVDYTRPGGSMIASAEDVGIFLRALIDGSLLSADEQEIYDSVYEYEHTGWLGGYTSIARYHSDIDTVVVQFVNTSKDDWFWVKLERAYSRVVRAVEKEQREKTK